MTPAFRAFGSMLATHGSSYSDHFSASDVRSVNIFCSPKTSSDVITRSHSATAHITHHMRAAQHCIDRDRGGVGVRRGDGGWEGGRAEAGKGCMGLGLGGGGYSLALEESLDDLSEDLPCDMRDVVDVLERRYRVRVVQVHLQPRRPVSVLLHSVSITPLPENKRQLSNTVDNTQDLCRPHTHRKQKHHTAKRTSPL